MRIVVDLNRCQGYAHCVPLAPEVLKLKGEEARRGEAFQKSFEQHKSHQQVLERKFDELLRQAKESPDDAPPPKRPFDFD